MGCVNTSSREFKALAAKNNIDANALELITHKYWIERGSEDLFPTDVYIQAQLGKTQYQEKGKSVRKLWKKNYSTPKTFTSMPALQRAQNEALNFFPPSALVHYKNAKGEYVLTVRQPVERVNHSAVDFFEDSFPNNVSRIDLGLDSSETYTLDKVQELYDRFNTDRRSKQLAEKVFNIAKDLGLKITFDESLPFNNFGRYTNNNTIVFKKSFFERDWMNNLKAPILLHEVIHSLTMYALSNQTKRWKKPEQIENFVTEMNSIFQDVRGHEALKGERGVTDLKEFVAELANPIFRQKLQSIDKKSIWQRILDAVKNFFGIETKSTYYNRAMNALDEALNAFDLDMYLRYNGARKLMQQGYRAEEWNFRDMTANELRDAVKQYYYDTLPLNLELSSETKQRMKEAEAAAKNARNNFTYAQENDDTGEMQDDAVNERIQQFLDQYGDLVKNIVPFSNKRGGKSFSVKFKTPKELIDQQNAPLLEQISIIDNMSDDDLLSTFALIEQEYADYELVNGEEEKPKGKSQHTGPQPFTFKDGTVINAPFKPNAQQADALNTMDEFIHSDETSMTLSGYAGTGKTSLMEMLAKKMQKEHRRIIFSATTNKAAAVLKSRVSRSGFDAYTLNKVFGISVEVDSNKAYNARNLVNVIKDSDLVYPGDVVVIDEASMINEENYKILNKIAEENDLKIIYVGDKAQLAPVNETQVSKVFRNGEGTVIELTQVERTDDNAILKEATAIRNGKRLSGESSFNDKGEGVAYIPKDNKKAIGDVVRHYVEGLQNDPNYFRILAYTNDAVTKYNEAVRRTLGYEGNIPHVGEPMTGYANWGYDYRTKSYRFINSESYKVTKVGNPKTVSIGIDGATIEMTAVPITLEDSMSHKDTFDYMDIKGNHQNKIAATTLAKEKSRLWEAARRAISREAKAKIYQQINAIDSFLFVNDNITEGDRFLQTKTIDFGYALTIHKSQGSTFTHVLMDDVDVQKANSMQNNMENAVAAVDLGEVGQDAANAELRNSEEVDLGDLSSVPAETTVPNQNLANIKQQLEYVGVSRATDTVTIISNNIKKEDSPLNHINGKDVKSDHQNETNQEENRSNNKDKQIVTVAPYFRQSLTTQNKETLEKATQEVKQKAEKLAKVIGLEISDVEVVGGTYLGSSEITYQYHIKSTDSEKVDLFASLMGDLSFEYQDAVIAANYTKDRKQATAIEVTYKVPENTKIEDVEKKLNEVGIDGSTLHFDSNELSIMAFSQEEYEDIVNKLENTDYEFKEFNLQNSRYLDNESRRNTYEVWNNSERGKQNRQLSNACSKALAICEAAAKFPEANQEAERLAAAQQAAKDWDAANLNKENQQNPILPSEKSNFAESKNQFNENESFVPHSIQMSNLAKETGEGLIQVDAEWKEQELKDLDRDLGQAQDSAVKEAIINNIYDIAHAKERVSLPNYEYFTDKYEDTLVDAEWKIPMLEELDTKISAEKDAEFNTAIINQMNAILQAKSEEEYHSAPKAQETVQQNLSEFDKLTTQINNLLDSNEITASEIRHIAELVVNSISDAITDIQKGTLNPEEEFIGFSTNKDMQKSSRKEIVEAIGINRLIDRAKDRFDPENADYEDLDTIMQAELITNNWDAIMTLASDVFAANEGFGIGKDYTKGGFQMVNNITQEFDSFNIHEDTESIEETEGDEQEHWQIESRTIDVLNSMSALVRQALHECYQVDKNGNKIISKWGIAERVNPRKTVNSILRWTQGSLSLEDMVKKLSDKANQNPWLTQLIERLSDTSGKETDFQSQFYGVFSKHFQPYSIVLLEDGKYASIPVNSHPALSEAMNTITTQYKVGSHALFPKNGINKKLLGTENTTYPEADFNLHKALASLNTIMDRLNHGENLDESMAENASANIVGVCRIMGYPIAEEMLQDVINKENLQKMTRALGFIVKSLDAALQAQLRGEKYNPFAFGTDNNIGGTLRNFLTPITEQLEDTAVNAFYDSGKMYQSYVTPSFMTKLMNKFKQEGQEFEDFIMAEYGNSEWFKFSGGRFNTGWRNEWLRLLATDENARKVFDHKVELNFNKHNYMRNMSDAEYTLSLITEYFAETAQKGQTMVPAWFRIPMLSNKPSSEFIKFYSYRGATYKDEITNGLYNMFLQELSRIQTVKMRGHGKNDAEFIKNFDSNGRKFNFLPFLNEYLEGKKGTLLRNLDNTVSEENARLAYLLQKKANGFEEMTSDEEAALTALAEKAIRAYMENRVQSILDKWQADGILEAAKAIKGIGEEEEIIRSNVENFLWNDAFASKNILQLTITDIAFYKDAEDLQKRLAQLHAPGTRGNVAATDYEGNRVSDGNYRTFILQDFDNFMSNIIANIAEVFDKKIAAAPEHQKAGLKALKESLVGENGKYTKINVADAQGYSSPASYRKKAFIFGRWSRQAEDIYQKLKKGEYNYTDLETAFQPLKPFVYSHLQKNMGVENAPIHSMPVPFQAKNAEYLLIMADAILQGEQLSRPNLLRAVYRVMEESENLNPTKGIDTVQFESAIKSGLQGRINIHQFADMAGGEEAAYTYMMSQLYKQNADGTRSTQYNTDTFVHEAPFEDYCLQQEVPAHFKEHAQAHGSQIRMIVPSDLDLYKNPNGDLSAEDNQVYYEWTEPDGTKKKVNANDFKKEYEQTIADNIAESINDLAAELHFNSQDKKERNIALSKILQREILSSPRYGVDLIQACSVDKETGEFRIPKGDPIQAKRIEQLINSIIKNRVNKQKIAGGPIVQVSNFGTSRQLHIRFNDKNGNLLMTEEEFKASGKEGTYKRYIKDNQAGIAHFEVFIPLFSRELFDKFANSDGTINVEAIEATDPELLKMVSYRIPTEDKYSMAPMKAVGFMPKEAGDAIMLPYELTEIDDSDFDVDKRYVMRKDIPIKKRSRAEIEEKLFKKLTESYAKAHEGKTANRFIGDQLRMFLDNPEKMRHTDALMESIYKEYQKIAYYTAAPTSGRKYRDNKIVDMTLAVLTNEMTADKILNPGGFDAPKKMGYMVAAYKNPANGNISWEQLQKMSIDELKDLSYTDKDLTWADTQIQFYRQNSAAASLIGVFAVNKVAHATLEGNDIHIAVDEICGDEPFTIVNTEFGYRMPVDATRDNEGNLIGKTLGSLVSASADAVKDPILNLMNVNMTTAGMLNTMLRLGMTFDDAALFLSQDIIERALNEFNRQNLINYEPLSNIIEGWLQDYREKNKISDDSNINTEPLTKEELIEGLRPGTEHGVVDYKVLLAFQKLRRLVDAMRKLTFATRFNSISSAVGPLIVDNLIIEHKMEQFMDSNSEDGTHFYTSDNVTVDIDDIFYDHPILKQFSRTVDVAKQMFYDMPAGSIGFRNLLDTMPDGLSDKLYNDKKLLDQLSNFYQSYLLVQSGMINPSQLKNYIEGFPKWFMDQNFKEKYPENALIQAIKMNVSKRTGRPYLMINITSMDTQQKEELGNAWIDLHKTNPDLSQKLFTYSFFRAGVGFSPKTFMSLVPTYVKERLETTTSTGKASYVETYRKFPSVNSALVIDQFIRNNWDNNKLVPKKGGEGTKYIVDLTRGTLIVKDAKDIADLQGVTYMKTRHNGQTYLWKLVGKEEENTRERYYVKVKPLGNNGEYLEMSLENIQNSLSETTQTVEDIDAAETTEIKETAPAEAETGEATGEILSESEKSQRISDLADAIMKQREIVGKPINRTEATNQIERMKKKPEMFGEYMVNVFKQMGLDLSKEEAIKEFKKLC